jgi:hypothetical protein
MIKKKILSINRTNKKGTKVKETRNSQCTHCNIVNRDESFPYSSTKLIYLKE